MGNFSPISLREQVGFDELMMMSALQYTDMLGFETECSLKQLSMGRHVTRMLTETTVCG
jgi:hypothetical protein